MKNNSHIIKRYLGCIILFLIPFDIWAERSPALQTEDSLRYALAQTDNPHDKITFLRNLAVLNRQSPKEVAYLTQLLEIADSIKSDNDSYETISFLGRYYANENRLDSTLYWVSQLDSLAKERNEIPVALFDVHNALCRYYLINSDFELAMNEAVKQQILAEKSSSKKGMISSDENIGLIYMLTGRFQEAITTLERCNTSLNQLGNEPAYELQIGDCLTRLYLLESQFDKAEALLGDLEKELTLIETSQNVKYKAYPSRKYRIVLCSYRVWLYSSLGNRNKTDKALKDLLLYSDNYNMEHNTYIVYNIAMVHYYLFNKNLGKALYYLDLVLNLEEDRYGSFLRIDILKRMGKKTEALDACKELLKNEKNRSMTAYMRQVDQLRSLSILSEQEKASLKLQNQQVELQKQKLQMALLIVFCVILFLVLFFLIRYIIHSRRLRNVLIKEDRALEETNEDLRVATEKAEKAERMKSNFVANISHEIRTPLNAIVGFSGLLKDSEEEERGEYIKIINNNSDLLLNLVSDVLDLSRLDTDDFTLNMQQTNIYECCQHAFATILQKVTPGVCLTFTHPDEPFITKTDPLRIQQLLLNLLANAAKFTDKGKINLDYRVNAEEGKIIFTVTDTGCGIPLEKQKIIFNRFEKVDAFKQGAGLGLSICKAISDCFGGELYIDPGYTDGARFIFILPIQP